MTKFTRLDVEYAVREPGFGLYHSLLDKKLRLGHIFPMVKVNFVFYNVHCNNMLQSTICESLGIL